MGLFVHTFIRGLFCIFFQNSSTIFSVLIFQNYFFRNINESVFLVKSSRSGLEFFVLVFEEDCGLVDYMEVSVDDSDVADGSDMRLFLPFRCWHCSDEFSRKKAELEDLSFIAGQKVKLFFFVVDIIRDVVDICGGLLFSYIRWLIPW